METEILARIQFALTIMFHYIYPPLSIGLGVVMVIMEGFYLKTRNPLYLQMAKFWTKIFALTFAVGVATGIVMEFEFGTNWATYSRYVGDVFGSALAAEGVFAFFLESGFLAILLFGWDRIGPKLHFFATVMVALGAHFSAIWIVVANAWMQTPAGFVVNGEGLQARAEIVDFWAMVFNPSAMSRLSHTLVGAWSAGAFLVVSVSAYYLLKGRSIAFAKSSLKIGLVVGTVALLLSAVTGDVSGKVAAVHQPTKLAAFEGLFKTTQGAPLTLLGWPNVAEKRVDYQVAIPKFLSFFAFNDFNAEVKGLDQVPEKDWPQVRTLFVTFRLMVGIGVTLLLISLYSLWKWWHGTLFTSRPLLWILVFSVMGPQIANQAGWVSAEMGRYPWIVYNLLRISEGLSKSVTANQIFSSILMFGVVYSFLLAMFIYLLNDKIQKGPEDPQEATDEFRNLHTLVREIKDGSR